MTYFRQEMIVEMIVKMKSAGKTTRKKRVKKKEMQNHQYGPLSTM